MRELTFAPLANFAEITMGQSPASEACNTDNIGLPFLQGCGEFGRRNPETDTYCFPPLRIGKANATLISVRAPVGTMNYADKDYCIGRGLAAFKSKPGIANDIFLKHAVEQGLGFLHRRSQGSTFAAVSSSDIQSFPIPYFSVPKQNAIASILTSIDTAIEKTEALIAKYQQIKAGLMQNLFTRGLLPHGKVRPLREQAPELYQETVVGWIPIQWSAETLGTIASFQRGHDIVETQFEPGPFPVVSSSGMIGFHSIATSKSPNVVIGRKGSIGKAHFLKQPFWAHDTSLYVTNFFGNNEKYVFYLCQYLDLARFGTKSGSPSLNRNDIHPISVGRPSTTEQAQITNLIDTVVLRIQVEDSQLHKLRKQKLGLMQDLLTGKVPVIVDAYGAKAIV